MTVLMRAASVLALALALPATASASCYFVYRGQNQLVYRSTVSPVDLSKTISEGLRSRVAGGHLVMIPDETGCPELLASGESRYFAAGLGASQASALEASPLFRALDGRSGAGSVGVTDDAPGAAATGSTTRAPRRDPASTRR